MDCLKYIEENKTIAICRKVYGDDLIHLANALYEGGIRLIEVTFDQHDSACIEKTSTSIRTIRNTVPSSMRVGAGTVLTEEQVLAAKEAGAEFIISPNVDADVIRKTKDLGLVSIPGAMTPTEILDAHKRGADIVKLFPSAYLGFGYIKDILAPISHVKLCATGGVTEENAPVFLRYGFAALGVGGRLVDKICISNKNFDELTNRARHFTSIVQKGIEK